MLDIDPPPENSDPTPERTPLTGKEPDATAAPTPAAPTSSIVS